MSAQSFAELLRKVEKDELSRVRSLDQTQASASSRNSKKDNKKTSNKFRWLQFGVYLWAGRLGLSMIGGLIPSLFTLIAWPFGGFDPVPSVAVLDGLNTLTSMSWDQLVEGQFRALHHAQRHGEPLLITGAPCVSSESLRQSIQRLTLLQDTQQLKVKVQPSRRGALDNVDDGQFFTYFTDDRPWSKLFARKYEYLSWSDYAREVGLRFPSHKFLDASAPALQTNSRNAFISMDHMYLSYPHLLPYLENFSPSLSQISTHLKEYNAQHRNRDPRGIAQASLWMSSPNVSATLHFDLDDNILFQAAGRKQIVLASHSATEFVQPFSSLHPLWRQSSIDHLHTIEQLLTLRKAHARIKRAEAELEMGGYSPEQSVSRDRVDTQVRNSATSSSMDDPMTTDVSLWQHTLEAGELLFLPAGIFHAVTAESDSVSVNGWIPSELSALHSILARVSLPFTATDPIPTKLSLLVDTLKHVCIQWEERPNCLSMAMNKKYSPMMIDKMLQDVKDEDTTQQCPADQPKYCTDQSLERASTNSKARRTAIAWAGHLNKHGTSRTLMKEAVLDYVDDVLLLILQERLAPCAMEGIINDCFS